MSQWTETEDNIKFSLSRQSDEKGRFMMLDALKQGSLSFMDEFKDGFYKTQDGKNKDHVRALFDACCKDDERAVYNIGRKINGQPPI